MFPVSMFVSSDHIHRSSRIYLLPVECKLCEGANQFEPSQGALLSPSDNITCIDEAKRQYEDDKYVASARAARDSLARTWLEYHAKAHQLDPGVVGVYAFPMTVQSLKSIACLMKLDGYRSFGNYSSWAKGHHIELGHDWTQQLAHELTQAGRSLSRGLGPSRQSAAFDLERLALSPGVASLKLGSPIFPKQAILLGSLWVLREIELAWAKWGDIRIDSVSKVVHWTLTASKTDPAAKSCTRKWGCLCTEFGSHLCPYHVMYEYRDCLARRFKLIADAPHRQLPRLPGLRGQRHPEGRHGLRHRGHVVQLRRSPA